ncbi:MAG TPA: glycosyltransferase family 2 protein [Candidatus Sulfotelmatobacter sp.]|nr:glycosyltransferase family 2 protein [Candidatus Sulfotelmatobacter sp.]
MTRTGDSHLVLVLLATFNGSRYLREQLDSIAAQTYTHWRLIVADDGSQDDTLTIVQDFSERHPGRVCIVPGVPVGSARDNFFRLLRFPELAPYFAFCDQDDVWSADKLERLIRQCKEIEAQHPGLGCMVYSDLAVVDAHLVSLNPSFMDQVRARPHEITFKTLLVENAVPGCAMVFNAALARVFRDRPFNPGAAIMHDWWIALLAATLGHVSFIPIPLVNYRQHATNTLGSVKRSGIAFVFNKLFRGDRDAALKTYAQATAFLEVYSDLLDPAVREDLQVFGSLSQRSKFERIRLILKHQMLKQTPGRRIYQLLRA